MPPITIERLLPPSPSIFFLSFPFSFLLFPPSRSIAVKHGGSQPGAVQLVGAGWGGVFGQGAPELSTLGPLWGTEVAAASKRRRTSAQLQRGF